MGEVYGSRDNKDCFIAEGLPRLARAPALSHRLAVPNISLFSAFDTRLGMTERFVIVSRAGFQESPSVFHI